MSIELLRELSKKRLPCTLTGESEIDRLRVLRAAGYIAALLPAPGSTSELGRVLAITGVGRDALAASQDLTWPVSAYTHCPALVI